MKDHLVELVAFNGKLTVILFAFSLTALKQFVGEHIFSDVYFLIGFGLLLAVDNVSGTLKAIVKHQFDFPTYFKKTITKVATYVLFIGGVSILLKIKVGGEKTEWVQWVDDYCYMGIALAEFWSIVQNINEIAPGLLPKWLTNLFQDGAITGILKRPPTQTT